MNVTGWDNHFVSSATPNKPKKIMQEFLFEVLFSLNNRTVLGRLPNLIKRLKVIIDFIIPQFLQ